MTPSSSSYSDQIGRVRATVDPPSSSDAAGAVFDETRRYRYLLWRRWDQKLPSACFVMLNPSCADEHSNDPTIRRCIGFAQGWGLGGIEVVNLFGLCTHDPRDLLRSHDPTGPENDRYLRAAIERAVVVIAAWGNRHKRLREHEAPFVRGRTRPLCLGLTRFGEPRHPLYLPAVTVLRPYR